MSAMIMAELGPMPADLAVHCVRVADTAALPGLARRLDDAERSLAGACLHGADRARYVTAHAALRELLGARLGLAPQEIRFRRGINGKPSLHPAHGSSLRFNLSHSGDWILIALSDRAEVGVDVERMEPHADLSAVAGAVFAPRERAALAGQGDRGFFEFFHRLWTCKEAWLKAAGTGLGFPLETLDLLEAAVGGIGAWVRVPGYAGADDWWCARHYVDETHLAAVVVAPPNEKEGKDL